MKRTKIEWTDVTWNPVTGCDRMSAGCDHCYAIPQAARNKAMGSPRYQADGDPRTSGPGFAVTLHHDLVDAPRKWVKPRRVFVNSMSDLFHASVPTEFIQAVFATMEATPQHTYQILTKRSRRVRRLAAELSWPENVWMGVSVENSDAMYRIEDLLEVPAAVRFLSCEPLLGPVDLSFLVYAPTGCSGCSGMLSPTHEPTCGIEPGPHAGIDWVIAGGESGPSARPMNPAWARGIRDACRNGNVPFFFKQWGAWTPDGDGMKRVGKAEAGRVLDGRTHDEYPTPTVRVSPPAPASAPAFLPFATP